MNQENARRENKAGNHQNNDDPTQNEEENNTQDTHGRNEAYQITTT